MVAASAPCRTARRVGPGTSAKPRPVFHLLNLITSYASHEHGERTRGIA
jgi:hypothetical protein